MLEGNEEFKYDKIMVIDDSETDRYIVEFYLANYFVAKTVIAKESAPDALEYLKQFAGSPADLPEIILLDIRMPVMDGFEFLLEYEKLPVAIHQKCRIIMHSSSMDPRDLERIKSNPLIKKFISKPLDKEKLKEILDDNLFAV